MKAIDIVADVVAFFARSLEIAGRAGIAREKIVLDPGIGFGKTPEQSIVCIARLAEFRRFGLPLLVGASRKRFINSVTPSAPDDRIGGSIASHLRRSKTARRSSARMTWRKPCRRCGWPPPLEPPDERPYLHRGTVAARLSRRDAA